MRPKTKRIVACVIAGILVILMVLPFLLDVILSAGNSSHAAAANTVSGLNEKLENLDKEKEKLKDDLARVKAQKQNTLEKKEVIDKQINVTRDEISTINSLISELNVKVSTCARELAAAQKEHDAKYALFKQRMRAMEENGRTSFVSVILTADSFSSLLSRAEIINDIVAHDKKLMKELKVKQEQIAEKKKEIEDSRAQQQNAKNKLAARNSTLNEQNSQAKALIATYSSQESEYQAAYNAAEDAQNSAKSELKKLLEAQKSGGGSYVGGDFLWPTPGYSVITSNYGPRFDPIFKTNKMHTGVDIGAPMGAEIVAANSGTVIVAGFSSRGYGNYVVINHGGGKSTLYAHQSSLAVSRGDHVNRGQTIGYVGTTGYSTGPHLHFEVLINGDDTNPMNYFRRG